jgi:DNA ligase (NAD+)
VAQRVVVRRAGEVIPEIVGVADTGPGEDETRPFVPPATCPNGHQLDKSSIIWSCVLGRDCGIAAGIRYAVSRDCLDIEGMGAQIVDALVAAGKVTTVADLFGLDLDGLLGVPRLGQANANKIMDQIETAKSLPLARILAALGIRGTGRAMSRRIASHFGTMGAVRSATVGQMAEVEGIGPVKAPSIVAELDELAPAIDRMAELGVVAARNDSARNSAVIPPSSVEEVPAPLAGMSVCVTGAMTGALTGMTRNEVHELIESLGGRAASSVSAKTSLLLTDDPESGSGKAKKARELGIEIITPDEFAGRYLSTSD